MIAFSLRFHGLFRKIAEYLDLLGPVITQWHLALGRTPTSPWIGWKAKSGGMINEFTVHLLYAFCWYAGDVEKVYARLWKLGKEGDIEDTASVLLVYKSGATSMLVQTWQAGHRLRHWGIQCQRGTATVEGYLGGHYKVSNADMSTLEEGVFEEPVEEMYKRQLNHFIYCVAVGKKPGVNEEDGLWIQRIVSAIHRSAAEGRPVHLAS